MRLIQSETRNKILQINNPELAKQLKMKPGVFYCYFKPSYLNGFEQAQGFDVDYSVLQAVEGICRDEFQPLNDFIASQEFSEELDKTSGIHTAEFSKIIFDKCFKRTFNVEFMFNIDMKEFR